MASNLLCLKQSFETHRSSSKCGHSGLSPFGRQANRAHSGARFHFLNHNPSFINAFKSLPLKERSDEVPMGMRGRWHEVLDEGVIIDFTPHQSAAQTASPRGEALTTRNFTSSFFINSVLRGARTNSSRNTVRFPQCTPSRPIRQLQWEPMMGQMRLFSAIILLED
jgi:hypothetical protein